MQLPGFGCNPRLESLGPRLRGDDGVVMLQLSRKMIEEQSSSPRRRGPATSTPAIRRRGAEAGPRQRSLLRYCRNGSFLSSTITPLPSAIEPR